MSHHSKNKKKNTLSSIQFLLLGTSIAATRSSHPGGAAHFAYTNKVFALNGFTFIETIIS